MEQLIHGADDFLAEWLGDAPAIAAHTSGSTGEPKPISLSREAMRASARATNAFFGINSHSTLVCPLSADYIAGKMMVVRALEAQCRLWMLPPRRSGLLDCLPAEVTTIDLLPIVPAQIDALLATPRARGVKNVIVGGAPMSPAQERSLAGQPFEAFATYGMTETCSHIALRNVSRGEAMFTALPGVSLGLDSRGCLTIGHLVTNDIVDLQGNRFRWLGRADNVIISGGVKVHPEEVERAIAPLMGDTPFYITSRPSTEWGRETVLLTLAPVADPDALLSSIKTLVAPAAVPKAVIHDPAPQYTSTGKLRRRTF